MLGRTALLAPLLLTALGHAQDLSSGTWVDLTHPLNEDAVFWPTAEMFEKTNVAEGETEGGYYYSAYNFSAAEHGGAHIDVSQQAADNRDYQITVEDVTAWEGANGQLPDGAIILFNTGFAQYYPDRERYMGTAKRGAEAVADLHFSGIHPDLAAFLASERSIAAVGLDTPSIDYGQSTDF